MLNRNDDSKEAKELLLFCLAAASTVLLLFLVVIYLQDNKGNKKFMAKPNPSAESEEADDSSSEIEDEESNDLSVGKANVVSEDLDFWDMYDEPDRKPIGDIDEEEHELEKVIEDRAKEAALKIKKSSSNDSDDESDSEEEKKKKVNSDRIKATAKDGTSSYFDILTELKKNTYDFEEYLGNEHGILKYNSPATKSIAGIDLSNKAGIVDFNKLKDAGIDYVMIKVGGRSQDMGAMTVDDKFVEYANGAVSAGIPIGAYFCSYAVNDVEAVEEANFTVAALANYNLKYPIAMDLSGSGSSATRADRLTSSERTAIVKKFCETVESFGKKPVICASRDLLIADLNLLDLKDYDIWLKDEAVTADYKKVRDEKEEDAKNKKAESDESESYVKPDYIGTDYPYEFSMWQYTQKGEIEGVTGMANLNMSFVDYAE